MTMGEKLNLIVQLSIPSILAQVTTVMMFYIDASMVGSLGAAASASIGLVEPATWLFGSLVAAGGMGFSVQAAHFIGANDFEKARAVMRHGYIFGLAFSLVLMAVAALLATPLPRWLGGGADIQHDASIYFLIFSFAVGRVFVGCNVESLGRYAPPKPYFRVDVPYGRGLQLHLNLSYTPTYRIGISV